MVTMPQAPPISAPRTVERELRRRLEQIRRVFDLAELDGRGLDLDEIAAYYRQSALAYRFVHSREGAIHMALNPDGEFDESGYYGQAQIVEGWLTPDATDALELASGNGFNSIYLAKRRPTVQFRGIDLVREQVELAEKRAADLLNATFQVADFHDLPFASESFDIAFVVESLCHATDLRRALQEARRVLRPAAPLIVIDAWRTPAFDALPAVLTDAARLAERAMSVGRASRFDEWIEVTADCGLELVKDLDLTDEIRPNLLRFERLASRFFAHPRLARHGLRFIPRRLLGNAISGYLMPLTVQGGAHTYRAVVLRRVD
jgi:SAM-dependent methyltransferase